jgi:hypothetical protein
MKSNVLQKSLKIHNFILSNFDETLSDESRARIKKHAETISHNLDKRKKLIQELEAKGKKK